jgi:glutamate synthase (ferredoxin)
MIGPALGQQGLYDPRFEHDSCGVGVVADLHGRPARRIVQLGLQVLCRLAHRGARGAEANTGDGAGLLIHIPHRFLAEVVEFDLPEAGAYGVGMMFLPGPDSARAQARETFTEVAEQHRLPVLGWRPVPTDATDLGRTARMSQPGIEQVMVGRPPDVDDSGFERQLYLARRSFERRMAGSEAEPYVVSLSGRTLVYKGMLTPEQVPSFYPDLTDPRCESGLALAHSRFSTNTHPSWSLAQPFRMVCHNGEINTLRGNINWMRAREGSLASPVFGDDLAGVLPVLDERGSDSAVLDQALELLTMAGRSVPHALLMMIPEAWQAGRSEGPLQDFFRFHACLMEPWDGPALVAFANGRYVGATLDRNGLRPARYLVTRDGLCVMASEVGTVDIDPAEISIQGRVGPGRMLVIDMQRGALLGHVELESELARARPYGEWVDRTIDLEACEPVSLPPAEHLGATTHSLQRAFGWSQEDLDLLILPTAANSAEPIGSMAVDTPLAVLSDRPRPLFDYFKQLFAQVTNPPIDAIREELVTSSEVLLGAAGNLLDPGPESCHRLRLPHPILISRRLSRLRGVVAEGIQCVTLPMLFERDSGGPGLESALTRLCDEAAKAVDSGATILILSDRGLGHQQVPIPSLLATAAVHHHLVRRGNRARTSLVVESGEPREPHHFCTLVGYGAEAINPYLVERTLIDLCRGQVPPCDENAAVHRYVQAIKKSIVKVMSKMGISAVQSYCGAQLFEAVGLGTGVIDSYFTGTVSRIGGIGLDEIAADANRRHHRGFPDRGRQESHLDPGGKYKWRAGGERHLNDPETITALQRAVREDDFSRYQAFSAAIDRGPIKLRDLLRFRNHCQPLPLDQVEPVSAIVRRFKTGAMSFGSISKEAHETLAIAMNRLGGKSNSGEGGEDPGRALHGSNGNNRRSAIKQVASGRFGVTSEYLVSADEIQIKIAQGAKPGEGGQLPGHKVDATIARIRHSTPGVGLISPPPHHDIYSIEDLAQLIFDLKCANPRARVNVKLVSEAGVGTIAAGVAKAHADVILISGHDGGTGASPLTSVQHTGLPWELGLAETQQTLVLNDLRSRVVLEVDGQMKTGRDVVVAAILGAEEYGFSTAPLVVMGCVMMRVCHQNTCPVGIATQDERLRARFAGKPEEVERYFRFVAEEVRLILASLGVASLDDVIGRPELLEVGAVPGHAGRLDLSPILYQPRTGEDADTRQRIEQDHGLAASLDAELIDLCEPALTRGERVQLGLRVNNGHRAVGTWLGSEITRAWGGDGLPDDTVAIHLLGSAGQSLAAFLPRGVTLRVEGEANDYLGKGLSGGRVVLVPPRTADVVPGENIITGNVALYGATGGEVFIRGRAGERFAVRNSGAHAVVEGVGDHGCEYMTGGRVVVLGGTGLNFAAGMSGGLAFVLDLRGDFSKRCNPDMVELEPLSDSGDVALVRGLLSRHVRYTESPHGRWAIDHWDSVRRRIVKVIPTDYKRALESGRA